MDIIEIDQTMMARCMRMAGDGAREGEYPFGSVVAHGQTIISEASNRSKRESDESRHAEIVAIAQARRTLGRSSLRGYTLYCTMEPCAMCSFCIRAAGLSRVVFALGSPVLGGVSHWDILGDKSLSRRLPFLFGAVPEIVTRVGAEDVQRVWSNWNPLVWRAIEILGFFVKPAKPAPL
jgi:tRNA(adenine34) deaminase